jgi:hypothetical protein
LGSRAVQADISGHPHQKHAGVVVPKREHYEEGPASIVAAMISNAGLRVGQPRAFCSAILGESTRPSPSGGTLKSGR